MSQAKVTNLLLTLLKPQWLLATKALILAMAASILEGFTASLVMPLIQIWGNQVTPDNLQLPLFIRELVNFYGSIVQTMPNQ